jgi:hypothetical protein
LDCGRKGDGRELLCLYYLMDSETKTGLGGGWCRERHMRAYTGIMMFR